MKKVLSFAALALLCAGCAWHYTWTSEVDPSLRTIAVGTMRNESYMTELGDVMTRQLLREIQREGTYKIASRDEAALEIQGVIKTVDKMSEGLSRRMMRNERSYTETARVEISIINKMTHEVVVDNRIYKAETTFFSNGDVLTDSRDASGRLAEDLARQVVDDLLNLKLKTNKMLDKEETKEKESK